MRKLTPTEIDEAISKLVEAGCAKRHVNDLGEQVYTRVWYDRTVALFNVHRRGNKPHLRRNHLCHHPSNPPWTVKALCGAHVVTQADWPASYYTLVDASIVRVVCQQCLVKGAEFADTMALQDALS